jgi:hypothetical protein
MEAQIMSVTLKGSNLGEIVERARTFIEQTEGATTTPKGKKARGKTAVEDTEDTDLLANGADDTDTTNDFLDEEEKPKAAKSKKITDKDVNAAAIAHAKHHGSKKATLKVLKTKFDVESITELDEDQYAACIKALKV